MRTKNFLLFLCSAVAISLLVIIFGQQKQAAIQNIVTTTHQHLQSFTDNLRDAASKTLVADDKYLALIGFSATPRLFPKDIWHNTSLPVVVTYVTNGQESQVVGFVNSVARVLPNNTILIYNLGLSGNGLKTVLNYCNSSRCQVMSFDLNDFPSHVMDDDSHAYRPLVIQDALQRTGAILFLECDHRIKKHVTPEAIYALYETVSKDGGIMAWPTTLKNAVSSRTHKKMFDYFRTDAENFLFLQMVGADSLILVNTEPIHKEIMLPWIECALTHECVHPIGAQSGGCRFNKKPQYRYSGCHSYDASALNIVLGLKFHLDGSRYTWQEGGALFNTVPLDQAQSELQNLEQNTTTEGKFQIEPFT